MDAVGADLVDAGAVQAPVGVEGAAAIRGRPQLAARGAVDDDLDAVGAAGARAHPAADGQVAAGEDVVLGHVERQVGVDALRNAVLWALLRLGRGGAAGRTAAAASIAGRRERRIFGSTRFLFRLRG